MTGKVYKLNGMEVEVILASRPTTGAADIITLRLRYPRIIHGELMTHRVFSRNARSSRAVPVRTMLEEVKNAPFIPWHWGKNQKGMQASEECNEMLFLHDTVDHWENREDAWLHARDQAVKVAEAYMVAGYHKQIANRLLEPFSYIDVVVTSTSWANFFHLRDHEDAEPHIHDLAVLMKQAINEAEFQTLNPGEWHLPYFRGVEDYQEAVDYLRNTLKVMPTDDRLLSVFRKLSVARCARVSYKPFDGNGSIEREVQRYEDLVGATPLHASPTEHQATPDNGVTNGLMIHWEKDHLAGNLGPGWVQFRKMLIGEFMPG